MTKGERVREIRKALDLTTEEFGARVSSTRGAISNIENGNRNLTPQMEDLITREFNVSADWLRSGEGDMFVVLSQSEKLAAWAAETLGLSLDHPRVRAWCMLVEMPDEVLEMVMGTIDRLHKLEQAENEDK